MLGALLLFGSLGWALGSGDASALLLVLAGLLFAELLDRLNRRRRL